MPAPSSPLKTLLIQWMEIFRWIVYLAFEQLRADLRVDALDVLHIV